MKSRLPKCASLSGPAQFEAVMSIKPCARSPHFTVHFLPGSEKKVQELSTALTPPKAQAVDDWMNIQSEGPTGPLRLGLIVSKRNARRAVTRNTVKRHWRQAFRDRTDRLPAGDWVVRLRAAIDRKQYLSGKSPLLADMLREEIHAVLEDALRRASRSAALSRPGPANPSASPRPESHA